MLVKGGGSGGRRVYDIAFRLSTQFGQGFTAPLAQAEDSLQAFADNISNKMIDAGDAMTHAITRPLLRLGGQILDTGMEFEQNMAAIRGVANMAGDEVDILADGIRDLAADGVFGLNQLSGAAENFVRGGSNAADTLEKLEAAMLLSAATDSNLDRVSYFINSVINKTGGEMDKVLSAVDSFAATIGEGHITFEDLQSSWNYVASLARMAGMGIDETNAAIATLANMGYRGSAAGTMFARMLQDLLVQNSDAAADAILSLGFSFYDAEGGLRPFGDVLGDLGMSLDDLETAFERVGISSDLFTVNGMRAADAMLANEGRYFELLEIISGAGDAFGGMGQAAGMAEIRQDTLGSSINQIQNQFDLLGESIYQILQPRLEGVIDRVQNIITWFSNLDDSTKETIVNIGLFAAAFGPALVVMGTLIRNGSLVIGKVASMTKAFIAFQVAGGPIVWILSGIAAAVGIGVFAWNRYENAQERARQAQLNFGEVLADSRNTVERAIDAHSRVGELVDRYYDLSDAMSFGALGARELADADRELAAIRRELEELASVRITQNALENLSMEELIGTVESLTEMEKELAIARLALTLSQTDVAFLEQDKADAAARRDAAAEQVLQYSRLITAINLAKVEMERFDNAVSDGTLTWDEFLREEQRLFESISEQAAALGHEFDYLWQAKAAASGYDVLGERLTTLNEELEQTADDIQKATNTLNEHNQTMELYARLTGQAAEATLDTAETISGYADALDDAGEALNDFTNDMFDSANAIAVQEAATMEAQRQLETFAREAARTFDRYYSIITDGNRRIQIAEHETAEEVEDAQSRIRAEYLETVRHNISVFGAWHENLSALEERDIDPKFMENLRGMGAEAADLVAAMANATEEELEELNALFAEAGELALNAMKSDLGIEENALLGAELIEAIAEHTENATAFTEAARGQIMDAVAAMESEVEQADVEGLADNIVFALVTGIENGRPIVQRAGAGLIDALFEASERAAQISSPSKRMIEFTESLMDGMPIAIYSKMGEIQRACDDVREMIEDSLRVEIPEISAPDIEAMGGRRFIYYPAGIGDYNGLVDTHSEGFTTAFDSHLSLNNYTNLTLDEDEDAPFIGRPIDYINQINESTPHDSGDSSFVYNAPHVTINGSGLSAGELEVILERRLAKERAKMERFYEDKMTRRRRLSNA